MTSPIKQGLCDQKKMDFAVSLRADGVIQLIENTEDNQYHYSLEDKYMRVLGKGANGRVYEVRSSNDENATIVIKDGRKEDSLRKDINNLAKLEKDVQMCSAFYQNAVVVEDKDSNIKPFVIMKKAEGGDLLTFVESLTREKWPEKHQAEYCSIVAHLSYSIAKAVNCLSRQKLYYFDLKLENILVPTDRVKAKEKCSTERIQELHQAKCLLRLGDHGSMIDDKETNITLTYWPLWMKKISFQQGLSESTTTDEDRKEIQHERKVNVLRWLIKVNTILLHSIHDPVLYNSLRKHFSFSGPRLRMLEQEKELRQIKNDGCYVWNHRRIYAKYEWNGIDLEKQFITRVVQNPESPFFGSRNVDWPNLLEGVFASKETSDAFNFMDKGTRSSHLDAIEIFHQVRKENNYMANIMLADEVHKTKRGSGKYWLELLTDFNFKNQRYESDESPTYFQKKAERLYAVIANGSFPFDPVNKVDKVYLDFFKFYNITPRPLPPFRVPAEQKKKKPARKKKNMPQRKSKSI